MGGIVVVLVMVVNELGYGLPIKVFFESESIVYYMAGAYVGIHAFQWFSSSSENIISRGHQQHQFTYSSIDDLWILIVLCF